MHAWPATITQVLLLHAAVTLLSTPAHGFVLPAGRHRKTLSPLPLLQQQPRGVLSRASAVPVEPGRSPEALRAFEAWLRERGGVDLGSASCPLALRPLRGDGGNYEELALFTTRAIEADQIVLAVPRELQLTPALPPGGRVVAAAEAAGLDALGRLALRLLYEASLGEGGAWAPYLRVLPARGALHLPVLWDEEEPLLGLLAPSPLHDDIVEARAAMRRELASLQSAFGKKEDSAAEAEVEALRRLLDWEHWTWARAVAMSRPYVLDPDDAAQASLTLIPVVDMANHADFVRYAVQRGDGVFTARTDVQFVADRAYPAGAQFWNTYGPLPSASKLYSFGFLDRLELPPSSSLSSPSFVPAQGTALFVVGLREDEDAGLRRRKAEILASVGLEPGGQRVEVATRTSVENASGPSLARVVVEDHLTAPALLSGRDDGDNDGDDDGVRDGGVERLRRYLRLKHLDAAGLDRLQQQQQQQRLPPAMAWRRLASSGSGADFVAAEVAVQADLEIVSLCQQGLRRVTPQLAAVEAAIEQHGGGTGGGARGYRLGLIQTLLHGEVLALRAVAEMCMAAVEAASG